MKKVTVPPPEISCRSIQNIPKTTDAVETSVDSLLQKKSDCHKALEKIFCKKNAVVPNTLMYIFITY
jgi:hypothetical protein